MDAAHYRNLLDARSQISSIAWTVFSIFGAGLAIVANGVIASSQQPRAAAIMAGVGLLSSVLWLIIQLRLHAYVTFYYHLIHRAEEELHIDPKFRLAATPKSPLASEFVHLPHASTAARIGILIAIGLWLITFVSKVELLLR